MKKKDFRKCFNKFVSKITLGTTVIFLTVVFMFAKVKYVDNNIKIRFAFLKSLISGIRHLRDCQLWEIQHDKSTFRVVIFYFTFYWGTFAVFFSGLLFIEGLSPIN